LTEHGLGGGDLPVQVRPGGLKSSCVLRWRCS
jgi:hypothetical protein